MNIFRQLRLTVLFRKHMWPVLSQSEERQPFNDSNIVLGPCYSECGLQAGRVGVPCKLLRNAKPQAPPEAYQIRNCILTTFPDEL